MKTFYSSFSMIPMNQNKLFILIDSRPMNTTEWKFPEINFYDSRRVLPNLGWFFFSNDELSTKNSQKCSTLLVVIPVVIRPYNYRQKPSSDTYVQSIIELPTMLRGVWKVQSRCGDGTGFLHKQVETSLLTTCKYDALDAEWTRNIMN